MSLFLCLPVYHWDNVVKIMLSKVGGLEKVYKVGVVICEWLSIEGGFKPSAHYGFTFPISIPCLI